MMAGGYPRPLPGEAIGSKVCAQLPEQLRGHVGVEVFYDAEHRQYLITISWMKGERLQHINLRLDYDDYGIRHYNKILSDEQIAMLCVVV